MPLVTLKQILEEAQKGGYAVGAYNVNNMEQVQGIMNAAKKTNSPVIIQVSRGALAYSNMIYLAKIMEAAVIDNPDIPICVHLDHGDTLESCITAIKLGFTSVMIDASHKTFAENVALTKQVVEYAHARGVSVEAELGTLGGQEDDISGTVKFTDVQEAKKFVELTGVDALAVAVGTSHGAYKFPPGSDPKIDSKRVTDIRAVVDIPLVLHGSSSVPPALREQVNKYGGAMADAVGIPMESLVDAIKRGVAKINVDSDSRMAMTGAIRKVFTEQPSYFDPRQYLGPARDAITDLLVEKMTSFGTAGHVGEYECKSLEEMKAWYAARK